ncbi:MAG: hypothetical protein ACE5KE_08955 [Methanosarcinales archaeon]
MTSVASNSLKYIDALRSHLLSGVDSKEEHLIELTLEKLISNETSLIQKQINALKNKLQKFESKYKLKSSEFYEKFENGELGDDMDFFEWYAYLDSIKRLNLKRKKLMEALD